MEGKFRVFAQAFARYIPLYAEEGGSRTRISFHEIAETVGADTGLDVEQTRFGVHCMVVLLDSLSLLDRRALDEDKLGFVSFPAWLVARSLLCCFEDPAQKLLSPTFWSVEGAADARIEEQRHFLRVLEQNRQVHHRLGQAIPIRYIYVAWALIKIDGKFLLHRREDTKERNEYQAGNYVMVGGRTNMEDVSRDIPTGDVLPALNVPDSKHMKNAAAHTLHRELMEEVGLEVRKGDYTYKEWRTLASYEQIQGARSNHALTRYYIRIFSVQLTPAGYFHLAEILSAQDDLEWFSPEELKKGRKISGETAYLTALHTDFEKKGEDLVDALNDLPDSAPETSAPKPSAPKKGAEKEKLELSDPGYCRYGKRGKEKRIDLAMSVETHGLLLALAAHAKGKEIILSDQESTILLPRGWVKLVDEKLLQLGQELQKTCRQASEDLPFENQETCYFRLSLASDQIFFSPDFFECSLIAGAGAEKDKLRLYRAGKHTPLGFIKEETGEVEITSYFAGNIRNRAENLRDTYRHTSIPDVAHELGLRDLIVKQNTFLCKLVVPQE